MTSDVRDETMISDSTKDPQSAPRQLVDDVLAAVTRRIEEATLPRATYRVQFNSGCTFREVEAVVPYLSALGISDLYASPFLQARPGSVHGYDIVNHSTINPEIGTLEDLRSLRRALGEQSMGLIADVVPNHMAAAPELNAWWQDVLENGPSSSFAAYFDIDWAPLKPDLAHKVLLPVLGDQYGKVLEEGQLVVCYGEGAFWLSYYDHRFPIAPGTYGRLLTPHLEELEQRLGPEHDDLLELFSILTAIRNLPPRTE
ncbi:MAG: maltooligosyl trehalose synthase, partial [Planctomycetales bacterium 12-60-4]